MSLLLDCEHAATVASQSVEMDIEPMSGIAKCKEFDGRKAVSIISNASKIKCLVIATYSI